ncbi:hypothetical protein FKP32DRAFT_61473 [Trametes sanguinea]|nr:hypothetical protein FKP32DRAFT_61473 [Trametes sanguinea]
MQPSSPNPQSTATTAYQRLNRGNERSQDLPVASELTDFSENRACGHQFWALPVLKARGTILHQTKHDMESFYWVLVWVVLRHTDCYREEDEARAGDDLSQELFSAYDYIDSHIQKYYWLDNIERLIVSGDEPQTALINRFNDLVHLSQTSMFYPVPRVELDHRAVLEIFNDILAKETWPNDDEKAHTPSQDERTGVTPNPTLINVPPGYNIHSERRALRSETGASNSQAPAPVAPPSLPLDRSTGSLTQSHHRAKRTTRSSSPDPSDTAAHPPKKSKPNNAAPALSPALANVADVELGTATADRPAHKCTCGEYHKHDRKYRCR